MRDQAAEFHDNLNEIDHLLRGSVAELVEHLRGEAHNKKLSNRRQLRFGRKGALTVEIDGPNRGRITDFSGTSKGMPPLGFIQSEIGGDFVGAVKWARAWLGIEGECPEPQVRRATQEPAPAEEDHEQAERCAKVDKIVAETLEVCGTPAEAYLRRRGITAALPDTVRWRPRAWGEYGAVVVLATDTAGTVQAVQQVYVTGDGTKAPLEVKKRTNGSLAGAVVRLPGTALLILVEGPETALSVWQATGCETWAALGGIGKVVDQVPAGAEVIVARDADPEGSTADKALQAAVEALVERGCRVRLACPARYADLPKSDFNDLLQREGEAAIRAVIATAEVFAPPAPHYPAASLPLDQARALLSRTINDFVAHAVTHDDGDEARQIGVKAAAGTGKTRTLLRELQARPEALEGHFDIFVPQHRLADELAQEAAGGPLQVQVIRGREYKQPNGSTLCAKAPEAREVARAGFSVWDHMCRRLDPETGESEVCEHFATCPYVAQFRNPEPAVRIMAHEAMFLPRNRGLPKPQAVVIDETFHAKALRQTDFALDRLTAGRPWRLFGRNIDPADLVDLDVIARTVRRALEAGEHPRDAGVTAEQCRFAAKIEFGGIEGLGITPGMTHADQRKRLDSYQRTEAMRLYRFWKLLETEIGRDGPLRQIELRRDVPGRDNEISDRIFLHWRHELRLSDVPVLVLDADLDPTITRKFLPRLEIVEVPVERQAEVVQVGDTACSRRRLLAWATAPEAEVQRASNRLADVQALLNTEAAKGARVLLVTYKEAAKRLWVPAGAAVEWFGNIRGLDRYKDFDTVIIAGREQPPVEAVEAQARALFADDLEPLTLTGALVRQVRGYRMRDGRQHGVTVEVHPDARVQALLEQVRERETGQALDRLRLIHRTRPARVIVLSNVVLDLTVDQLVSWKEIVPGTFRRVIADNAMPLVTGDMADAYPNLFPTREAAKKSVQRVRLLNGDKPLIDILLGECPQLATVTYRRQRDGKRAVTGQLAYDPRRVDPAAWLAEHLPGAELTEPATDVVVTPTMPAEIIDFAAAAARLADLSARLDRVNPARCAGALLDDLSVRLDLSQPATVVTMNEDVPFDDPVPTALPIEPAAPVLVDSSASFNPPISAGCGQVTRVYVPHDWGLDDPFAHLRRSPDLCAPLVELRKTTG
jgi:putative DNA primase/helicase